MKRHIWSLCFALVLATGTLAHVGVENPAVMARMHTMKGINDNMKMLVQMNKGERPFDQAAAQAATAAIAGDATKIPAQFQTREDDPKSEAKPEIWDDFADFSAKSDTLVTVATRMSQSIQTATDLQTTLPELGQACLACHEKYRIKKE